MLKKGDILLVAGILAAAVIGFAVFRYGGTAAGTHKIAVIKQNDVIIRTIDLDEIREPERITIQGDYPETILAEKGRIRFEEAECPDRVCVKTGWLSKPGETSVCLPNRTIIKIEGHDDEIDVRIF